jgi:hypothetical protein
MSDQGIPTNGGLLFMKVGLHAGETFDEILARKRREYDASGMIFWGYGGSTCHPTRCVQPFSKIAVEQGKEIYIVMEEINSKHPPTTMVANEFSEDGINWQPIPKGIEVRGSRYAVVLGELQDGDLDLDLGSYRVGAGPSLGKPAAAYIGGRVDKACITKSSEPDDDIKPQIKKIQHFAKLQSPYAVFTR